MSTTDEAGQPIGLVLAGGGARGAYEIGALSVLLPRLAQEGQRISVYVGTSVGALNVAWLAANAHREIGDVAKDAIALWMRFGFGDVLAPVPSGHTILEAGAYALQVLGIPRGRITALFDPGPLKKTVEQQIGFRQIEQNVKGGAVHGVGVVGTSALTGRSVVFEHGVRAPNADPVRRIDYVAGPLREEHVLASAAIPCLFPAVEVKTPARAAGWYYDGGTRLNTPIKPALKLGAERVIVIGLNSTAGAPPRLAGPQQPDVFQGAGQLLQALLADPLTHDVRDLATRNAFADERDTTPERIPYIFVAPRTRGRIAEIAREVFAEHYAGHPRMLAKRQVALLGRLICGGESPEHGDLLSYVFFAPEFAAALITAGQEDAAAWIEQTHDDGLWQCGPLPIPHATSARAKAASR